MINIIGNIIGSLFSSGYDQAVSDWLSRLDSLGITKPSAPVINSVNELVIGLKTNGLWSRGKTLNIYGFGAVNTGVVNIFSPLTYQHTFPAGNPDFLEGSGIKSNNTTTYVNTQYAINEYVGIETDLTTIIYISESSTASSSTKIGFGSRALAAGATPDYRFIPLATAGTGSRSHYGTADTFLNSNMKGLYIETYKSGNSVLYKDWNGVTGVRDVQAVVPIVPDISNKVFFLARNGNGAGGSTPSSFMPHYCVLLARFDSFSDSDATTFKTLWDAFRVGVGLLVVFASSIINFSMTAVNFSMT